MANRISKRAEVRIPVSAATRTALNSFKRASEPYDVVIRRLLITGYPRTLDNMTQDERQWVLIQETGWQYPDNTIR